MSGLATLIRALLLWISGGFTFILIASVTIFLVLIGYRRLQPIRNFIAKVVLFSLGIKVRVRGAENLQPGRPLMIMGNHVNLLDPFVIQRAITIPFTPLELEDHFRWPIYGSLIKGLGHIPVNHRTKTNNAATIRRMRGILDQGKALLILPEGHRTRDGKLREFKRGGFKLAMEAGVPILPFTMKGSFELLRTGNFLLKPGTITVTVHPLVSYEENLSIEELSRRVRATIQSGL